MRTSSFFLPTRAVFGLGCSERLNTLLPGDARKPLLVTDPFLSTQTEIVKTISRRLQGRDLVIFDRVEENPSFACVDEGRRLCAEAGCDLVIGVGGGSSLDAAKGIALVGPRDVGVREILSAGTTSVRALPVVCVPTTSGTGSEVTPYVVFTDREGGNKCGYGFDALFPAIAVIDPALTSSMPEKLVVDTGLDVVTHALEAFLCSESSPASDAISIESLRMALGNLENARRRESKAMEAMAYASMLAGMAITLSGTVLLHIMAYPLTVHHGVPHGRANAVLLPSFLDYMALHAFDQDKVMTITGMFAAVGGARSFVENLGVSCRLRDHNVIEDEIDAYVAKTIVKSDVKVTPARITSEEIKAIYQAAM